MNKLVKGVSKTDLYNEFLKSLNGILDLTDRELQLLSTFIQLDINTPKEEVLDFFSFDSNKEITND